MQAKARSSRRSRRSGARTRKGRCSEVGVERVAVLGGGLMGSGIAEVSAAAGLPVVVREINDAALEAARERIETSLARAVSGGKATEEQARETLERVHFTTHLHELADADLV